MLDSSGILDLNHNWVKPGWVASFGGLTGVINNDGTMVQGSSPGFINEAGQNFHLAAGSATIDAGTASHPRIPAAHTIVRQYVKHQMSEPRPASGAADIGAFEIQSGANQPPAAAISANPTSGVAPLTVGFDGSGSSDSDGQIVSYGWGFGDGGSATGVNASHSFINPGSYTATLTVTDDDNASSQASIGIAVVANVLAAPVLAGIANGSVAALSWTHPGADGFELQRGVRKKGVTTWATIAALNSTQTAYQEQPGRGEFFYRVRARRGSGASIEYSSYSNEVRLSLSRPRIVARSRISFQ
jgi:PKD repeat protein